MPRAISPLLGVEGGVVLLFMNLKSWISVLSKMDNRFPLCFPPASPKVGKILIYKASCLKNDEM